MEIREDPSNLLCCLRKIYNFMCRMSLRNLNVYAMFLVCSGFHLLFLEYDSLNNSKKHVLLNVACFYTCLMHN
jgi:hypothetical protein